MDPLNQHDLQNWNELVRRMKALGPAEDCSLPALPEDARIECRAVPGDDPTGVVELLQTMKREHIEHGLRLAREFPAFESFYCPVLPWKPGYAEAEAECSRLLELAFKWCAGRQQGVDYEVFSDVAGEVTAFHFRTPETLKEFRIALGLDPEGGFQKFAKDMNQKP